MGTKTEMTKLGLIGSFAINIPAAILMFCLTNYLIPLIFIQSYIVQRTKNSWVGVIMHGGLNGPSFIAICFGLI